MKNVENKKEHVSLLMDDWQQDEQVLDHVLQDDDLKDAWNRFNLVRDVLNDDYSGPEALSISDRVAKALDEEKCLSQMQEQPAKVYRFPNLFRQASGFAVAASVCAFVLLGVQYQPNNEMNQDVQNEVVNNIPKSTLSPFVQRSVSPVSLQQRPSVYEQQQRQQLQQMLAEHFAQSRKYSGAINVPYVKVVTVPKVNEQSKINEQMTAEQPEKYDTKVDGATK